MWPSRGVANGCEVDVTGRIAADGSAGTVSCQWLFAPRSQVPQPVSRSVVAGQHGVYVTAATEGQGRGGAGRDIALQILGPARGPRRPMWSSAADGRRSAATVARCRWRRE